MKTYYECLEHSISTREHAALETMIHALDTWDPEKLPELPLEYVTERQVYNALRSLRRQAMDEYTDSYFV